MKTYTDTAGQECVIVANDDGSTWSGLKSAYDTLVTNSNPTGGN